MDSEAESANLYPGIVCGFSDKFCPKEC